MRTRPLVWGLAVAGSLFALTVDARAEAPVPRSSDESPFAPVVRELGKRLGVDLEVGRVAVNPLIGAVILRDVEARSGPQGRFLTARRVVIRLDPSSGGLDAQTVDVEGAQLRLDLAKAAVADERGSESASSGGKVRLARLADATVELRDGVETLLRAEGIGGKAADVMICDSGAASGGVCASLDVDRGSVDLGGEAGVRLKELKLSGALAGRRVDIRSLEAGVDGGGRARCEGKVTVFAKSRGGTSLRCELDSVRLFREGALDVLVSGEVRIEGRGGSLHVKGTLDAVGGSSLHTGSWGKRGAKGKGRATVDLRVRVSAPSGRLEARVKGTLESGRVVVSGRRSGDPEWARRLLRELAPAPEEPPGGGAPDAGAR